MSTAKPTAAIFDQGAGRVDVARAVTQQVATVGGSLSFGIFTWPHTQPPSTKTVSYRNDGDAAVTLALRLDMTGPDGKPAPDGLFTVPASQVTVPPHGTADVGVTATPAPAAVGLFGGRLTPIARGVGVRTPVDAFLERESFNLGGRLVSRTGQIDGQVGMVVNTVTGGALLLNSLYAHGIVTIRLSNGS